MKVALISDIHSNFPALKAVIEDIKENNVDLFAFVGDYIFDFAYPNEVVDILRNLDNAIVIKGNKENYLKCLMKEDQKDWKYEQIGALYQTYRELTQENISYLVQLPEQKIIDLPFSGKLLLTHHLGYVYGSKIKTVYKSSLFKKEMERCPFDHNDFLNMMSNRLENDEIAKNIDLIKADIIVYGHSHLQWYGRYMDKIIINPGSCGQPLDYDPRASYTIIEDTKAGLMINEKRVEYDVEEVIEYSRNSQIYKHGRIWSEVVYRSIREAVDHISTFLGLAKDIAKKNNFYKLPYSNEIWNEAADLYFEKVNTGV